MNAFTRCALFFIPALLIAPAALAILPEVTVAQYTTLSANSCRPTSSSADIRYYSAPRLRNQGPYTSGVVCPIAFDASKNQLGARIEVAGDLSAARCRLSLRHRSGSTSYTSWRYVSAVNYLSTTSGSISIPLQSVPATSSANLECVVPGARPACTGCAMRYSEIKAIRIVESE